MAIVIPFRAVRPTRANVGLVAARSYDSYTTEERNFCMNYNPCSFLHIVNPNYKSDNAIKGQTHYELVRNKYLEFKEDGIFIKDDTPAFYSYKIVNHQGQEFNGIIAATSAEDYKNNVIKKHEDTIAKREKIFKSYLKTVGFNAEPVLLTYPDNAIIAKIIENTQKNDAEFEFAMTHGDVHYLWKIDDEKKVARITEEFKKIPTIYIADGHHRSSSSYLFCKEEKEKNTNHTGKESYNFFMSYLIPESNLVIHEFNRLIKDLNGLNKEEFLGKLNCFYRIENKGLLPYTPSKPHCFSMYLDGEFYALHLQKDYTFKTALDKLDAQLLYKTILLPILGIIDLRNDNRIAYVNGQHKMDSVKSSVDKGEFAVAFGMCPATMTQIKHIADEGLTMPPKSTYILPKLKSGVTIYEY